jgi:hypothetical protein
LVEALVGLEIVIEHRADVFTKAIDFGGRERRVARALRLRELILCAHRELKELVALCKDLGDVVYEPGDLVSVQSHECRS